MKAKVGSIMEPSSKCSPLRIPKSTITVAPPATSIDSAPLSDQFLVTAYAFLSTLSGSSTVAIDNKIEQAMDLVKSHLMFAVREEVEVLKEQIKELIEKNSQLEYENSILKAAASQETLAKLSQPRPQPPASSS